MEAHTPAPYDKETLMAIRACVSGTANDGQQKTAMDWIITQASNLYDMSYRKGDPTATAFMEGRRFVGNQIVKMTREETLRGLEQASKRTGRKQRQEAKDD